LCTIIEWNLLTFAVGFIKGLNWLRLPLPSSNEPKSGGEVKEFDAIIAPWRPNDWLCCDDSMIPDFFFFCSSADFVGVPSNATTSSRSQVLRTFLSLI